MKNKVTVVGAGFVGATCAQRIVEKDIANVVLLDVVEGLPQGKALDIMESAPVEGFTAKIVGTNEYKDTENSDIIVIVAGMARKPGMSRDDLQIINAKIVNEVVMNVKDLSPNAIIIIVTNPLDVMTYLTFKISGFPGQRVIGMAGILDSARYRYFISQALGVTPNQVQAMVFGGHGDSMVPIPHYATVNGIPITQLLSKEKIEEINQRTKNGGAEIVGLLKMGSAYYAPSAAAVEMVKSILYNENKILPCSVYLNGQYGLEDVYCGVPVKLSRKGVEKIIELELTKEEKLALKKSSETVKENIIKVMALY
ncbi:MAG: malate dehydrogenase [Candidatus Omnitrophica bacterium]|nr:malate dehydrogenase [Candidatus Omnitrophota bacterium]MCK5492659.1 malate dehydrogenase [Candidatus Omnitrophota bacterium]